MALGVPGQKNITKSLALYVSSVGYKFQQYSYRVTHEAHQKPWRAKIKQQVERVVYLAEACYKARQNEIGWRLKLESEIFARFYTEVAW